LGKKKRGKSKRTARPAARTEAPATATRAAATPAPGRATGNARGWRIVFLVLCTIGACLSADLLRLHVNVHTDPDYHSYCAMSERVNCDTVAASDYSVVLGLPLALWGLVGYVALGVLTAWGLRGGRYGTRWPLGIAFWLGIFCSVLGVALLALSHWVIESVCVVCGGTYLVNIALGLVAWMALRSGGLRPGEALSDDLTRIRREPRPFVLFTGAFAVILLICGAAIPAYWRIEAATGPGGVPRGVTAEGHQWIGAEQPLLEIVEYSDYQCPHCQRGHDEMRKLVAAHPDKVRLVHRHYPMDQQCNIAITRPFHPYACAYARLAHCAGEQEKFWETNDYLYGQGRRRLQVTAEEIATQLGLEIGPLRDCLGKNESLLAVQRDLGAGRKLNIRGTPTFVIDGRTYPGRVPQDVIDAALGATKLPPGAEPPQSRQPPAQQP
jgi:protein-disulfide isomerase/uncharacterized membrane protein